MGILLRILLLAGGVTIVIVFVGFGLFFLGWVFSRGQNGW
jgi:hypothetical protein